MTSSDAPTGSPRVAVTYGRKRPAPSTLTEEPSSPSSGERILYFGSGDMARPVPPPPRKLIPPVEKREENNEASNSSTQEESCGFDSFFVQVPLSSQTSLDSEVSTETETEVSSNSSDIFRPLEQVARSPAAHLPPPTSPPPPSTSPTKRTLTKPSGSPAKSGQPTIMAMFQQAANRGQGTSPAKASASSPAPAPATPAAGKTSPNKKLALSPSPNTSPTKLVQSFLDLGQKNFGPIACPVCKMTYQIGQAEDEEMHAKFHKTVDKGISFPGWKNEDVLATFDGDRIIVVGDDAPTVQKNKVKEIVTQVNEELGAVPHGNSLSGFKIYLYISSRKEVIGCLVAERITHSHRLIPEDSPEESMNYNARVDLSKKFPALCGVNRIWVKLSERRSGIASRLADTLRHHFIFGCEVELSQLAFSQPTENGRNFAQRYVGRKDFLVYNEGQATELK